MKSSIWSCTLVFIFFAGLALPATTVSARDGGDKPLTFAAAQSSKHRHLSACRARYRDCLKLNQIPSFECQWVYEDCIRHMT
jgi:hypothetical protein